MNILKTLSDTHLLSQTESLVKEERRVSTEILHHLREIERRDLHLKQGYSSLFVYMVECLKYSEGSAHRRISALRLLNSLPVLEAKKVEASINTGAMSLTTVAMVQNLVKFKKKENAPLSVTAKLELLSSIQGKSKKEVERVLISHAPSMVTTDKERLITEDLTELKVTLDSKLMAKLKRIKELRSHKNVNPSYSELLHDMADLVLGKIDPLGKKERGSSRPLVKTHAAQIENNTDRTSLEKFKSLKEEMVTGTLDTATEGAAALGDSGTTEATAVARYIPAKTKTYIWKRDKGQCTFKNPLTGKLCGSAHLIQIEHKKPFAKGGSHHVDNLTLHCAAHNQLRMREEFLEIA